MTIAHTTSQTYFLGSLVCFLISAALVAAETRQLPSVSGADNCDLPCYEDTFEYYECLHYNPPPPYSDECLADCSQCPHVDQEDSGCIKDTKFYAFCEVSSGSGGDCPMKDESKVYLTQNANTMGDCTSTTNPGGTWNRHDHGECEFFPQYCTAYETTACAGPYDINQSRTKTVKVCDN